MRKSVATVSLSGTLQEKLEAIAAARFDGVEIFENDLLFYNGSPKDVRRQCADIGLAIDMFQPFRDFEGVNEAQFKRNLDRAERKFDVMQELGAPLMLVCSNVSPDAFDDVERSAAQMFELAERAAKRSIKIGFEALAWGAKINTYDKAWKVVEKANHPHLGLVFDSFHTLALPQHDWSGIPSVPGDKVFYVQLADAPRLGMNTLTLSRHFRNLPGQGDLDVPGFLRAVIATGYAGTISLEIFNDDMRSAPPRQTALDAMRSLLFLEEQVRLKQDEDDRSAATGGTVTRRRRVPLFDPPEAPKISGISFVEFTVDKQAERDLTGFLTQIGFAKIGTHRSKQVTLYGQGDVRFVVNREPDSFAHSFMLVHGPSVCALAIKVDDAQAAMARAESYGCQRFESRVGPNEKAIPAIRMPNGGLIYFTDEDGAQTAAFESDFIIERTPPAAGSFARVDHIAEALPEGQLDGWVLFYRAVLGLSPEEIFVLPDPYGLMRSKAVSNAERTLRLPLNISESRNTATARSVSTFAGAGVHHIAFHTADIFEAVRSMEAAGAPLLRIPGNYYDDIGARFALDDALLEKLRAHNVLYDKIGDGEFFHVFTQTFDDRFFFEACQRTGGYDQYGAANAPVRMAAQAHARDKG